MVAPNPNNPYPVYQMLRKADNFKMDQLIDLYAVFNQTDMALKRSAQAPQLILEEIIFRICAKQGRKIVTR